MDTKAQIGEVGQKRRDWHQELQVANLSDLDKLLFAQAVKLKRFEKADDALNFIREFNQQNGDAIPFREFVEGGGLLSPDTINDVKREYGKLAIPKDDKTVDMSKPASIAQFKKALSINIDFNLANSMRDSFGIKEISMLGEKPAEDPNGTVATSDAQIQAKPPSKKGRDRYELVKQIGKGGMGVVYLFHDKSTDRDVVMKTIIPEDWCSDLEAREQMYNTLQLPYFKRESKITMALVGDSKDLKLPEEKLAVKVNREISQGHKHIVPMRDYVDQEIEVGGQILGKDWLKLELVKGETLDKLVLGNKAQKIKNFSRESEHLRDRLDWYMKICAGIAYAHEKGIINRDIKPANMLLDTSENNPAIKKGEATVRIIDWGLAKHYDEKKDKEIGEGNKAKSDEQILKEAMEKQQQGIEVVVSMQGDIKGTLTHMAPEQAAGKADKLADVYALGAILHEMMTGKHYRRFIGEKDKTSEQLVSDIVCRNVNYSKPSEEAKTMNPELEAIILKGTAHKKQDRYQSVAELMRDVKAYLTYNEVGAYRGNYTKEQKDALYQKRNARSIAARKKMNTILASSAAGVLAVVGSVWGYMQVQKSHSDTRADQAIESKDEAIEKKKAAEKEKRDADEKAQLAKIAEEKEAAARIQAEKDRMQAEKDKLAAIEKARIEKEAREKEEAARKEKRNQAEAMVNKGKSIILNKGDLGLEEAIKEFTLATIKDPEWREPYYQRGLAQYSRMYTFEAIQDFKEANERSKTEIQRPYIEALLMGGWVNVDLLDRFEAGAVKYPVPPADTFFQELIKARTDDDKLKDAAEVLLAQSMWSFFKERKFEDVYNLAQSVKRDNPEMWQAYYTCSTLESKTIIPNIFTNPAMKKYQNNKAGLEDVEKALSIQKKRFGMELFRARIHRLDLYVQLGETDRVYSEKALAEVRAFKHEWAERSKDKRCEVQNFNVYEAMALRQIGKYDESLRELKMALVYEEKNPQLNNGWSLKPLIQEEQQKSQQLFDKQYKQKPKGK